VGVSSRAEGFSISARPPSAWALLADVWASRRLLALLARKDFYVRFRRASFGVLWAVGMPVIQAAVLAVVFSRIVRFEVEGNYPTFVFAGILPWTFFNQCVTAGTTSVVDGAQLATKVYFPRALLPLVVVGTGYYMLLPGVAVLIVMMFTLAGGVGLHALMLVPGLVALLLLSAGFALVLSALFVYFRDLRFVIQAALLVWFWITPVVYPIERAPGGLRTLIELNPVSGVILLFRFGALGGTIEAPVAIVSMIGWAIALLVVGLLLQRRFDRVMVDLL
jgi:ABC-type polysaccharide/polyol phosphate export permease